MQFNPLALALLVPTLILGILMVYAWHRRRVRGARGVALLLTAATIYCLGYILEITSTNLPTALFWIHIEYIGIVTEPVFWLVLVLQFSGQQHLLTRRNLALLFVIPAIILLLNFTNNFHHLYYATVGLDTSGLFPLFTFTPGPWYWVNVVTIYIQVLGGSIYLLTRLRHSSNLYRRQATIILIGSLAPITVSSIYLLKLTPWPHVDITPFALTVSGAAMVFGIFRYYLLTLVPIARDILVENMEDGIFILDNEFRIVDSNPAAMTFFDVDGRNPIGQPVESFLSSYPEVALLCRSKEGTIREFQLGSRHLSLQLIPLTNRGLSVLGHMLLTRDITNLKRSAEELRTLFSVMNDVILVLDREGRYVTTAPTRTALFYRAPNELIGKTQYEVFPQQMADTFTAHIRHVLDTGEMVTIEYPLQVSTGLVWFAATISPMPDDKVIWVARDITKRKQAEEALRLAKEATETANIELRSNLERVEKLNELSRTLSTTLNLDGLLKSVVHQAVGLANVGACLVFLNNEDGLSYKVGYPNNARDMLLPIGQHPKAAEKFKVFANRSMHTSRTTLLDKKWASVSQDPEIILIPLLVREKKHGVLVFVAGAQKTFTRSDLPILESAGRQVAAAVENARLFQEIQLIAQIDSLTGLFSRRHFLSLAEHEFKYSFRYSTPFSLIMIDIDHFKIVNDTFGHAVGDKTLIEISRCIQNAVRGADIVGRYGGEEIVVLLTNTQLPEACQMAERLRYQISMLRVQSLEITASFGVVQLDQEKDNSIETIIHRADTALYIAKKAGRNRVASL